MNVAMLILIISKNGSRTGKRREPASTQCSRMCGTPVSSDDGVGKVTENRFLRIGAVQVQQPGAAGRVFEQVGDGAYLPAPRWH